MKEAKEAKETKKRGRMIDGQSGGLQIMGDKRRKKQEVAFGRGSRQLRDDEDALDSIGEPSGPGMGMGAMGAMPMGSHSAEETDTERIRREEAELNWAPPSASSQQKQAQLAASLGY